MNKIKAYWWPAKNFGDTLTPIIIKYLTGMEIIPAGRGDTGKLLAVGSILHLIKENDVVWGTGLNRPITIKAPAGATFLAVRGPITRKSVTGADVPEVYGDPGILLPLIYNPKVEKKYSIGYLPHYVDKPHFINHPPGEKETLIDIQSDWKNVIERVKECETIVASSLHGVICAEAYGIPAIWVKYTDKIVGGDLKYNDYFLGTGRGEQKKGELIPPIQDLSGRQEVLIKALTRLWKKQI
jgi:pyruvyltransferase